MKRTKDALLYIVTLAPFVGAAIGLLLHFLGFPPAAVITLALIAMWAAYTGDGPEAHLRHHARWPLRQVRQLDAEQPLHFSVALASLLFFIAIFPAVSSAGHSAAQDVAASKAKWGSAPVKAHIDHLENAVYDESRGLVTNATISFKNRQGETQVATPQYDSSAVTPPHTSVQIWTSTTGEFKAVGIDDNPLPSWSGQFTSHLVFPRLILIALACGIIVARGKWRDEGLEKARRANLKAMPEAA